MGKSFLSLRFIATALLTLDSAHSGRLQHSAEAHLCNPRRRVFLDSDCRRRSGSRVVKDGPCQEAGVNEGDFLREINGRPVATDRDVTKALYALGLSQPPCTH